MSVEQDVKSGMKSVVERFKQDLKALRSARANPAMLDHVHVEVYGTAMRLKELANVTIPEPRQLLVTPFDPQNTASIAKGIESANLNVQVIVDKSMIRINVPPMDEAMRKEIVKQAKKKAEEAKVSVRDVRRKSNELARKQKADGDITEDVMKKLEKVIQEQTDHFCKEIDTVFSEKEKEILSI